MFKESTGGKLSYKEWTLLEAMGNKVMAVTGAMPV